MRSSSCFAWREALLIQAAQTFTAHDGTAD
jgi:hypothetical protein